MFVFIVIYDMVKGIFCKKWIDIVVIDFKLKKIYGVFICNRIIVNIEI